MSSPSARPATLLSLPARRAVAAIVLAAVAGVVGVGAPAVGAASPSASALPGLASPAASPTPPIASPTPSAASPTPSAADPAVPRRPSPVPSTPPPAHLVFHGDRGRPVVALTFDDGYAPDNVRRIFATLQAEHVPATFFVNGWYLSRAPALWQQIAAAGYPIGDHTYYHTDVTRLSSAGVAAELLSTAGAVRRVTGHPIWPIFRPPYGSRNAGSDAAAAAAGFPTIVMWDVSGVDADRGATPARVAASASAGRPGSIILLHAGPSVTPKALPAIIAAYRSRGFGFVTIPQLLGIAGPVGALPPPPDGFVDANGPPGSAPPGDDRAGAGSVPTASPAPAAPASSGSPTPAATVAPIGSWDGPASLVVARPSPPPARDVAWARSDGALGVAGELSLGLVGLLVAGGALAGRRRRPDR